MKVEKIQLADFVDKIFWDIFGRIAANPLIMFYPNFFLKQITEADKRYFANCKSLRNFLLEIVKERKATA